MPEYYCDERYVTKQLPTLKECKCGFSKDEMLWIQSGVDKIFFSDIYCFRNYLYKLVEDADANVPRPSEIHFGFGTKTIQYLELALDWYATLNEFTMRITEDEEHFHDSDYTKAMDLTNKAQDMFVLDRMELVFDTLEVKEAPTVFCRKDIGAVIAKGDDSSVYGTEDDLALMQLLIDSGYIPSSATVDVVLNQNNVEMAEIIISAMKDIGMCAGCHSSCCKESISLMELAISKSRGEFSEKCLNTLKDKFPNEKDKIRVEKAVEKCNSRAR